MKIVIEDFVYYGHHFDKFEVKLPDLTGLDEIDAEMMIYEHVIDALNFERSFYPFKDEDDSV